VRFLYNNLLYKIVALLVAAILWASAQGIRSFEHSLDIPISLEDVPEQVVIVGQSAAEVNLHVVGSRAAVHRVERQVTRYPISVRGVKPGEARFPIELDRLEELVPRGATITARSPSSVKVRVDPRGQKKVVVRADLVGELPAGFRLVSVSVEPEEVMLEGSQTALRRIREVLTDRIELETLRGTTQKEVRLAIGSAHIWRADDEGPIRVDLLLEDSTPEEGA
jgi:YbbR domain-containing protein